MSKDPWIKWFPGDFLGGVSELEPNEGWVYTVVLNLIYDGGGPWPLNLDRLARRCRMRPTSAQKALDTLIDLGKLTLTDGHLSNRKAEKSIKSRQKVSENSTGAANTRWEKERAKANENKSPDDADAMHEACGPDANQKLEARSQKVSEANASSVAGGDVAKAFAEWNALAKRLSLPVAQTLTPLRKKAIRVRLAADGMEGWRDALAGVEASSHCRGENDRGWKADLDFVTQPKSYQRLRERFYGGQAETTPMTPADVLFDGPPDIRAWVAAHLGEPFARSYVDPARWDAENRALLAANPFAESRLARDLADITARWKFTVRLATANDPKPDLFAQGAAA